MKHSHPTMLEVLLIFPTFALAVELCVPKSPSDRLLIVPEAHYSSNGLLMVPIESYKYKSFNF